MRTRDIPKNRIVIGPTRVETACTVAKSSQAQDETDSVAAQLGSAAAGDALHEVTGPEITMPDTHPHTPSQSGDDPCLPPRRSAAPIAAVAPHAKTNQNTFA